MNKIRDLVKNKSISRIQDKLKSFQEINLNKQKDIFFIEENKITNYSIKDNKIYIDEVKSETIKKGILTDSLIDLKVISVPVVSLRLLKNLIINTVKKHSTIIPTENNIDYIILSKEENKYEVLVFIKLFDNEIKYDKKQLFSVYHIVNNIINDTELPDDSSFLVEVDNIWFLYSFKERKFKKRTIYYKNDIQNLKEQNVYFINLYKKEESLKDKKIIEIPPDKLNYALSRLKNPIFKEQKKVKPKKAFFVASLIFVFLLLLTLQFQSYQLSLKKKNLTDDFNRLTKIYEQEKAKRGISDEVYKEYLNLFSKKSNVNDFFKNLYVVSKDNVEITKLLYEEGTFTITGYCKDDSFLENQFRESSFWKNVSFSFTRKNNKIQFNIKGQFVDE